VVKKSFFIISSLLLISLSNSSLAGSLPCGKPGCYDFVTTGIFNKITFIGMNFQYYDQYLSEYNGTSFFSTSAFLDKTKLLKSLCKNTLYNPGPRSIEQCIQFDE
jgi:hypothetical protein